jgi:DNA-binding transcriptional LysR family regulator
MDRLLSMRVFCRVAARGSFSRASAELGISNAVASRLVADLEEHLHIRLLNRSTRNVNLTEAGQEYFQRCESILDQIDESEAATRGQDVHPSGRLRMLVGFTDGLFILARHLPEFRRKYPNITLDIHLAEQVVDIVEKQFDLAIQPEIFVYSSSVVVRELMSAPLILCATPEYLVEHGEPRTPEELNDRDCVTLSKPWQSDHWLLRGPTRQVRVHPNMILTSNNLLPVIGALRSGMGIGLIFENLVRDELAAGSLVRVLPDYHYDAVSFSVVYPSRKHLPAKVRVMVEFLLGVFDSEGARDSNQSWMFGKR